VKPNLKGQSRVTLDIPVELVTDADATITGEGVAWGDCRAVQVVFIGGTITDGEYTCSVEDSDNGTDWAPVPAGMLDGDPPVFDTDTSDTVAQVAYLGGKQYVRASIATDDAVSDGGVVGALIVRAWPYQGPLPS
jgi:hypothetical protein